MPGKPPHHSPSRDANKPGAKRGPRGRGAVTDESGPLSSAASAAAHAQARSRVISSLTGATYRIFAVVAVFAVLVISFVSSYSVYLGQLRDIAQAKTDIAASQDEISRLQDELMRWQDPAYVRAQARDRLGWVMPGETGYRVVDENGNVIGGTVDLEYVDETPVMVWYEALWISLEAADRPVPEPQSDEPVVIGPDGQESPR